MDVLYFVGGIDAHSDLSVVGDKLNLDIGTASGKLGDTNARPGGLGVGHELLVDLLMGGQRLYDFPSSLQALRVGKHGRHSSFLPEGCRGTHLVDGVKVLAELREVDVGLDDVGKGHVGTLEHGLEVLDDLAGSVLDL